MSDAVRSRAIAAAPAIALLAAAQGGGSAMVEMRPIDRIAANAGTLPMTRHDADCRSVYRRGDRVRPEQGGRRTAGAGGCRLHQSAVAAVTGTVSRSPGNSG